MALTARERQIVAYTATAHALIHTIEFTYAAVLGRIGDEFSVGPALLGGVANAFGFAFGATGIPSGFLVDRLGSRNVLTLAFLGAAAMAVLVAVSPNIWVLAASLTLLGLTLGLYHPAGISLIAQGVQARGLAIGYHGVTGNLGIAVAAPLAIGLSDLFDNWRAAYFCMAILSAVMVLFVRWVGDVGRPSAREAATLPVSDPAASPSRRSLLDELRPTLAPLLLVYLAGFILIGFVYRGGLTFLPLHIEEEASRRLAAGLTTAALITGSVGQYVGGHLTQRFRLESLAPPLALIAMLALVLMGVTSGGLLVFVSAVFVFAHFAGQPVYTSLVAEYTPARFIGRSYGVSFFATFGIGSLGGTFAGLFAETWGTAAVFTGLSAFMAVTLALSIVLWLMSLQRRRQQRPALLG